MHLSQDRKIIMFKHEYSLSSYSDKEKKEKGKGT